MAHDNKIWFELARRTATDYCPELAKLSSISLIKCRDILIPAICKCWNLGWSQLPGEETFYNAVRGDSCGCVMKERFAILYYARIDKSVTAQMPQLLLAITALQRNAPTPFYNRFVEEYEKENAHPPRLVLPEPLEASLRALPKTELQKLKEAITKIEKEGRN